MSTPSSFKHYLNFKSRWCPCKGWNCTALFAKANGKRVRQLNNCVSFCSALNHNYCQSPRPSHLQEKFSPRVNNYFNSCYVSYNNTPSNYYGGQPSNNSPSPRPYGACTWHRGGRFYSHSTRSWLDDPNLWDSPTACSRSPSILTDKQPRKRLSYINNISKQSKRSKPTLGREYRSSLIAKFPKQLVPRSSSVTNNADSCSTPKKDPIAVIDGKSPEALSESRVLALKGSEKSHPFDFETCSETP